MQEIPGIDFQTVANVPNHEEINWLQIYGLQNTELIREICSHPEMDFLTLQDILNAEYPTKIEEHDKYTVLIMKIFRFNNRKEISPEDEMDELEQRQACIIQGSNFVFTFLENETNFFDGTTSALHNNVLEIRNRQSDYLLSVLLNSVTRNYISIVSTIGDSLENLGEESLTISDGSDTGIQIQTLRQQHMLMKKAILPLKEQYVKLLRAENSLMHKASRASFDDVNDHLQFVSQTIEICQEMLPSLVDLYISNNDLWMNDIMKRLAIVSTIFIPLTSLVGVWGMSFKIMPELDWRYGYVYAWILVILVGAAVYWLLRKRKWYQVIRSPKKTIIFTQQPN